MPSWCIELVRIVCRIYNVSLLHPINWDLKYRYQICVFLFKFKIKENVQIEGPLIIESPLAKKRKSAGAHEALDDPSAKWKYERRFEYL